MQARGTAISIPAGLVAWMKRETKLANPALEAEVKKSGDPDLTRALAWSKAVNETIGRMVMGVPPFPLVRESLARLSTPGRFAGRLGHAQRSPAPRMGRARSRQIRRGDLRAGDRHEERSAGQRPQVSGRSHADDRRRAGRLSGGPGQRHPLLSDQPGGRGSQLAAFPRRRDRPLSCPSDSPASISKSCSTSSTAICPQRPPWLK